MTASLRVSNYRLPSTVYRLERSDTMKRALMVHGGWQGHQPRECVELFAPILREAGYEVEIADTLDVYLNTELMLALDLVVPVWTMGTITKEQEKGLLDAVASGVGIAGWHGGMADS